MTNPVSKATALPAISIGFALILAAAFVWIGKYKAEEEADHAAVLVRLERVEARFNAYSGRTGENTLSAEDHDARFGELEKELSVILDQEVGR